MAEDRTKALEELANWCRNQRQSAINGINFFAERQKYLTRIDPPMAKGPILDGPYDHIAGLKQTIRDMDELLADIAQDES